MEGKMIGIIPMMNPSMMMGKKPDDKPQTAMSIFFIN